MRIAAEFLNGKGSVVLIPEDDWEARLLGAITKGGESLSARVVYGPDGHFSHNRCKVITVYLEADK